MDEVIDIELKIVLIKKQKVFAQLNSEEIEMLATLFLEKHLKSGTTIVTEGEPVDSIYLIVTGKADVRHVSMKDHVPQVQHLATLDEGAAIGLSETGFYSLSGVRTATVVADSDMVLLRLSVPALNGFALAYPHVKEIMNKNKSPASAPE
jgi:CRP-like cAMP-binding protein